MTLTNETKARRHGRFTASEIWKLFASGKGNLPSAVRAKYVREVAESKLLNWRREISSWQMDHGNTNEMEAMDQFRKRSGLIVEFSNQQFIPIGEDGGATPDGFVVDFDSKVMATIDVKCPVSKFFEQKVQIVQCADLDHQMTPVEYYWQAQTQMLAASLSLGYPVERHYLVRWFTTGEVDEFGDEVVTDLPDSLRMFWKVIERNSVDQKRIISEIEKATIDREYYLNLLKKVI